MFAVKKSGVNHSFALKRFFTNVKASESKAALAAFAGNNEKITKWVETYIALMKPDRVHFADGSEAESKALIDGMVRSGTLVPLNPKKRPNSYLARSDVGDVARVEKQTYICTKTKEDCGPTNNWADPKEMRAEMYKLYDGVMAGRTMYVVPYSMGPYGSKLSYSGIEITDSPYVVQSMKIMARVGPEAVKEIAKKSEFVPGVHTVGVPLKPGQQDSPWPCNPNKKITHFPDTREIMSYGSGYGGNALLGKKCFALRIAGTIARDEGWLAEHMLILGITNPQGQKKYVAAAFPSACGKTNFAMMQSTLKGWKIECVGDDIAWMRYIDGKLYAINPENGFFGVAPGTSMSTNPMAMRSCEKDTVFTNVALTEDNDVWWEGMSKLPVGTRLTDWLRRDYVVGETKTPAAHPNSRFCAPAKNCPIIDPNWESTKGVPIDAIIFGGRRGSTIPLVMETRDWVHGVMSGATMGSEQTAAAEGTVGSFRPDPMAMIPFGSYNIGDYFAHWLKLGSQNQMPKIFFVNFFKKNAEGKFIWPGFGENSRLLKWIFERVDGKAKAVETPVGRLPDLSTFDLSNLNDVNENTLKELFKIDKKEWTAEIATRRAALKAFGSRVPQELFKELDKVEEGIKKL